MTHDDYLKRLYILQDLLAKWWSWRCSVEVFGIRDTITSDGFVRTTDAFERTYRNYRSWCRRHYEDNLFISY